MTYQMTALQQQILDDQCEVLIPNFEPSDEQVKECVNALMRLKSLKFPTITLDWEFITERASEDVELNLDIHTCVLRNDFKQARFISQTYYLKTATDLVRMYIQDYNQLPRIV